MAVGTYRTSAVFNPFTFEQMIKPYQIYTEAYNAAEKDLNDQLDKYATIEQMADDSIRDRIEQYKTFVNNTAEKAASGDYDYKTLTEDARRARDYYRDYAPKIAAAYEIVNSARKAQQELRIKDPSAALTPIPTMREAMDNPDFQWGYLSGDKIHKDMVEAGQNLAKDINSTRVVPSDIEGYTKQMTTKGYTKHEQDLFARLASAAITNGLSITDVIGSQRFATDDNTDAAIKTELANKFVQPWQSLSTYISRNGFDRFNQYDQSMLLNRALSGMLEGMTGSETPNYIKDLRWEENSQKRIAKYKHGLENPEVPNNNPVINPVPAPQVNSPLNGSLADKLSNIVRGNGVYKVGDSYMTQQQTERYILTNANPYNAKAIQFNGQNSNNVPQTINNVGIFEASAALHKRNKTNTGKVINDDKAALDELNKLTGRAGLPQSNLRYKERDLERATSTVSSIFKKYNNYEQIPEDEKDRAMNYLFGTNGALSGLASKRSVEPNKDSILSLIFDRLGNGVENGVIPDWALTKDEMAELEKNGVRFYDSNGNPRNNFDITFDAWDLLNKQHQMYEMTGTRGAEEEASKAMTHYYFSEFSSQERNDTDGRKVLLKPKKDSNNTSFEGYNEPMYYLEPSALRSKTRSKIVKLIDSNGNDHYVRLPLSRREDMVVENSLNQLQSSLNLNINNDDFLKYIEMGAFEKEGINIDMVMTQLSNAIIDDHERNFKQKKSETNSKLQ